jgi:hypothetical protein
VSGRRLSRPFHSAAIGSIRFGSLKRSELLEVLYALVAEMTMLPVAALAPHLARS